MRRLAGIAALLVVGFLALAVAIFEVVDAYAWVAHTSDVRVALSQALRAVEAPNDAGVCAKLSAHVDMFASLTSDRASQQARVPRLRASKDRLCAGDASAALDLARELIDADATEIGLLYERRAELTRTAAGAFGIFSLNVCAALALALSAWRERRRVARALAESEERFRHLAESATDLIRIHAVDGRYLYATPSSARLLGFTPAEMLEMPVGALFHPDERDMLTEYIANIGRDDAPPLTHRLRRASGDYRWFETRTHAVLDENGKLDRFYTTSRDVQDRVEAQQKLEQISVTDELTQLYNRRGFTMLAGQEHRLAQRQGRGLLLIYADLDGLKRINDGLGHEQGDAAIRDFAEVMRATFRASDVLARLGGDEFAALAFDVGDQEQSVVEERLRAALIAFNANNERPYELAASLGSARLEPGSKRSLDDLIAEADKAMYEQKRARPGRAAR